MQSDLSPASVAVDFFHQIFLWEPAFYILKWKVYIFLKEILASYLNIFPTFCSRDLLLTIRSKICRLPLAKELCIWKFTNELSKHYFKVFKSTHWIYCYHYRFLQNMAKDNRKPFILVLFSIRCIGEKNHL